MLLSRILQLKEIDKQVKQMLIYTKMRLSENAVLSRVKGGNLVQCLGHRRTPRGVTPRTKPEEPLGIRRSGTTPLRWNGIRKGPGARTLLGSVSPAYDGAWNPMELQIRPER